MPKVDPDSGEMMSDEPEQEKEELSGGEGSFKDPDRETGDEVPTEQQVTGH